MKAVHLREFGGPEILHASEHSTPVPGASQVLVEIRAIGVNPVDALCRAGEAPWITLPFTPGFDAAGLVAQSDADGKWPIGTPVYLALAGGTYAEYVAADASAVHALPPGIDFETGAALGIPYFTAHGALFGRAALHDDEYLLVRGASGAVGAAAVELARAHGIRVLGSAGSDAGLNMLRDQGIEAFDHRAADVDTRILAATDGRGVDVILEVRSANIGADLQLLAPQGRIVVIGDRSTVSIDPLELTRRSASILGFNVGSLRTRDIHAAEQAIAAGLLAGTIRPRIAARFPLADAAQAHTLLGRSGLNGKIILLP